MKVALFGAGRIGKVHAASIAADPDSRLVAVTDVVPDAARDLAARHGAEMREPGDILADPAVDAILIASSTDTHADLIEAGIAAGKAIFCEKPIDLDLARARKVAAAAAGHDRPVMVGFNRRFDPQFASLKAALDAGQIGRGEMLAVTSFDPAPPPLDYVRVSGGLFRDMTIHDFDICAFLFGLPHRLSAHGACLIDPAVAATGDVDTAVVVMDYADGRIATIRNSRRAAYGYDQRVEVLGADGMLELRNVAEDALVRSTEAGVTSAKPVHFFLERYARAYAIEWAAFVAACRDGTPVPATVQDGVNALAMAEAANRSLATGRPVEMSAALTGAAPTDGG